MGNIKEEWNEQEKWHICMGHVEVEEVKKKVRKISSGL